MAHMESAFTYNLGSTREVSTYCRGIYHCTCGWFPVLLDRILPKQENILFFECIKAVES